MCVRIRDPVQFIFRSLVKKNIGRGWCFKEAKSRQREASFYPTCSLFHQFAVLEVLITLWEEFTSTIEDVLQMTHLPLLSESSAIEFRAARGRQPKEDEVPGGCDGRLEIIRKIYRQVVVMLL